MLNIHFLEDSIIINYMTLGSKPMILPEGTYAQGSLAEAEQPQATILPKPSSLSPGRAREKGKKGVGGGRIEEGEKGQKNCFGPFLIARL